MDTDDVEVSAELSAVATTVAGELAQASGGDRYAPWIMDELLPDLRQHAAESATACVTTT